MSGGPCSQEDTSQAVANGRSTHHTQQAVPCLALSSSSLSPCRLLTQRTTKMEDTVLGGTATHERTGEATGVVSSCCLAEEPVLLPPYSTQPVTLANSAPLPSSSIGSSHLALTCPLSPTLVSNKTASTLASHSFVNAHDSLSSSAGPHGPFASSDTSFPTSSFSHQTEAAASSSKANLCPVLPIADSDDSNTAARWREHRWTCRGKAVWCLGEMKEAFIKASKRFFGVCGLFIYDRPYTIIGLTVGLALLCGVGWLFKTTEDDLEKLFVLPATRAQEERQLLYNSVGPSSKIASVFITSTSTTSPPSAISGDQTSGQPIYEGILRRDVLKRMATVDRIVKEEVVYIESANGQDVKRWSYRDVCKKWNDQNENKQSRPENPVANNTDSTSAMGTMVRRNLGPSQKSPCMSFSILEAYTTPRLFGRATRIFEWPYLTNIRSRRSYPLGIIASDYTVVFKGVEGDKMLLQNATGFTMIYQMESIEHVSEKILMGWQSEFTRKLKQFDMGLDGVRFDFVAEDAWEEEIIAASDFKVKDYICLAVAIALILIYALAINFSRDLYKAKPYASICGCVAACLGMMVGGGIAYVCGLTHVAAMNTAPFLVLGIGLDDMFVILNAYSLTYLQHSPRERIRQTLEDSGIAITITTLTNLVSFLIGAIGSPYHAVSNFCWVVFAGLLGGYVYALTYFIAVLALEADREAERRLWIIGEVRDIWDEVVDMGTGVLHTLQWVRRRTPIANGKETEVDTVSSRDTVKHSNSAVTTASTTATGSRVDSKTEGTSRSAKVCFCCQNSKYGNRYIRRRGRRAAHSLSAGGDSTRHFRCTTAAAGTPMERRNAHGANVTIDTSADGAIQLATGFNPNGATPFLLESANPPNRLANCFSNPHSKLSDSGTERSYNTGDVCCVSSANSVPEMQSTESHLQFGTPEQIQVTATRTESLSMECLHNAPHATGSVPTLQPSTSLLPRSPPVCTPNLFSLRLPQCSPPETYRGLFDMVGSLSVVPVSRAASVNTYEVAARLVEVCRIKSLQAYGIQALYVRAVEEELARQTEKGHISRQVISWSKPQGQIVSSNWTAGGERNSRGCRSCCAEAPGTASRSEPGLAENRLEEGYDAPVEERMEHDEALVSVFEPTGTIGKGFRKFFMQHVGRWFDSVYAKAAIIALFLAYTAVSIYGITILSVGMDMSSLFPRDSNILAAYHTIRTRFPSFGATAVVFFPHHVPWWEARMQDELVQLDEELQDQWYTVSTLNGMKEFVKYYNNQHKALDGEQATLADAVATLAEDVDKATFERSLADWLRTPVGRIYAEDFQWEGEQLTSWRIKVLIPLFNTASDATSFMVNVRELVSQYGDTIAPVAYSRGFRFSETDLVILSQTLFGMFTAFIAVVVVSFLVLRASWCTILVSLMIFLVDIGLLGFMPLVGLELNMVTMVTLIMSIGFSVDYTLHVVHTFTDCVGPTRRNRMIETLVLMGVAVTNGCISTFLGIFPLCWRMDEYMHQLFFKMIALILLFGFMHGVLLLPVLLSIVGPISDAKDHPHPPIHPQLHSKEQYITVVTKATTCPPPLYHITSAMGCY